MEENHHPPTLPAQHMLAQCCAYILRIREVCRSPTLGVRDGPICVAESTSTGDRRLPDIEENAYTYLGLGVQALVTRGGRRSGPLLTGTMTRPTGRCADAEGATIRAFGSKVGKVIVIGMLATGLPLLALARARSLARTAALPLPRSVPTTTSTYG
jgi:hypothetical protein